MLLYMMTYTYGLNGDDRDAPQSKIKHEVFSVQNMKACGGAEV
jgi:hypothetical protein